MEPSNVLIALEEWEKWRSRKTRLERELAELRRRREELRAELDRVKKEMATIEAVLLEPTERPVDAYSLPPFHLGR
jgi:predicted  nucleic acid-binding Zn-ribbon protein